MVGQVMLSLLTPLVAFTCGGLFGFLAHRWPQYPYLFTLSLGFVYLGLGFLCMDLGFPAPPGGVNFAANALVLLGVMLACLSTLIRASVRPPVVLFGLALLATAIGYTWFVYGQNSTTARILVFTGGQAVILFVTFVLLVRAGPRTLPDRLFAAGVLLAVLTSLIRPVLLLAGMLDSNEGGSFTGSTYWLTVQAFTPLLSMAVTGAFVLALVKDIVDAFRAEADHDYLTGLLNRRGFETAAQSALVDTAKRPALLVADIDDFKAINDSFGHKVGDMVITAVAQVLVSHGGADLAGRMGGEEFALFYVDADPDDLVFRAASVQQALTGLHVPGVPPTHAITVSMGLHSSGGAEPLDQMLVQADQYLYLAKKAGKNRAHGRSGRAAA